MQQHLGHYRLVELLGEGSLTQVYRAIDLSLDHEVALKVLKQVWSDDSIVIQRFMRASSSHFSFDHPNIIQIYDVDHRVQGQVYVVQFLVYGESLAHKLLNRGPLSWTEMLDILRPVSSALDYAHSKGVVHQNIKPSNILLDTYGNPYLDDFGFIDYIKSADLNATNLIGNPFGNPCYIAPEIWNGQKITPATDVYALSCVVVEMLTGEVLFRGSSKEDISYQHLLKIPDFPTAWSSDVPTGARDVLAKGLAKRPEDRYQSAGELARSLESLSKHSKQFALVFVGYSQDDEKEKNWLISHLSLLRQAGLIEIWSDEQIKAGADWEAEISQAIIQAKVAILLVTSSFLTSEVSQSLIIPHLRRRHQNRELEVFVVIAKACAWKVFDWLTKMEVRPRDGKAIWSGSDSQINEALTAIVEEVAHLGDPTRPVYSYIPKAILKERRVDAAVPNNVEIGQSIDLLVQVRFPNSLLLGIEDWPVEQKPSSIKQKTGSVNLEFPINKQTGKLGSARLKIKVVTADFKLEGSAERLVEVPPFQYSKLISFLLTPLKTGNCRINVDVFSADEVYLGTIAIVTTVVAQQGLIEVEKLLYRTISVANFPLFINVRSFTAPISEEHVLPEPISSSPQPKASTEWPSPTLSPSSPMPRKVNPITTIFPLITTLLCVFGIIGGALGYQTLLTTEATSVVIVSGSATATQTNVEFTRTPTRPPTTTSQIVVSPSTQKPTYTPTSPRMTPDTLPLSTITPTSTSHPTPPPTPTHTSTPIPPTTTPRPTATKKPTSTPRPIASPTQIPHLIPTANLIVYVQSDGQNRSLGLVSSAGELINGDLHRYAGAPAWSPDGERIAFFGDDRIIELSGVYEQGVGVWTINDQGTNPKQVISIDHVKNIAWSPDGTKLALEVSPPTEITEVRIVNPEDGKIMITFPGQQPAWSPNSQKLIIKTCAPGCGLWQVDFSGGNPQQLTSDSTDSYPSWSPNGQNLAFMSQNRDGNWEVYQLRLSDGKVVRLTNRSGTDITPVFGPDGREIYLRTDAFGGWRITVISLDGSDERTVKEGVGPSDDWGLARPAVR